MTLLKNNLEIIFFSLIFYGLSFFLIIKEYLIIYNLPILELYRFLIILVCLLCFFVGKKTFNKYISFLVILNLLFLYNSIFGEKINFSVPPNIFYGFNDGEKIDIFFLQKNKVILINTLNVILPLIAVSFLNITVNKINKFKNFSIKICDVFLVLIVLLLSYKYFSFVIIKVASIETISINLHSSMYFLNIYFLVILDRIFQKYEINIFIILRILLIFYCFFIGDSILHPLICLLTFTIYLMLSKINKNILIMFSIFFFVIFASNIFKLSFFHFELIKNHFIKFDAPGTVIHSLLIRLQHIDYFIFYSNNLNYLIGNNIFADLYTYPHNLLVDIFVTTGIIGLVIFIYIIFNLIIMIRKNVDPNNIFILILFFQSFVFSNLSGFFFTNIILNISLAACLCFLKLKHPKIS